jgi:hypothetical protein
MNCGLGNQAFQYIFARYLEELTKTRVFIDDSAYFFEMKWHNGYELNYVFPKIKKPLLLSEYFEPDVWQYMTNKAKTMDNAKVCIAQQLYDNGLDLVMLVGPSIANVEAFTGPKVYFLSSDYDTKIADIKNDIYFYGSWLDRRWFDAYKDIFLQELTIRPLEGQQNLAYERAVRENFAVGVHIRRGDFVELGWSTSEYNYHNTINQLANQHPEAVFFIFSDDIPWCKDSVRMLGLFGKEVIFVEGNSDNNNNYCDLYLMTQCNVLIKGLSSFSYLAKILNQQPGFESIYLSP